MYIGCKILFSKQNFFFLKLCQLLMSVNDWSSLKVRYKGIASNGPPNATSSSQWIRVQRRRKTDTKKGRSRTFSRRAAKKQYILACERTGSAGFRSMCCQWCVRRDVPVLVSLLSSTRKTCVSREDRVSHVFAVCSPLHKPPFGLAFDTIHWHAVRSRETSFFSITIRSSFLLSWRY